MNITLLHLRLRSHILLFCLMKTDYNTFRGNYRKKLEVLLI